MNKQEMEQEQAVKFIRKFNLARNGGGVRRYHTHRVICDDTVASHSWGVAVLLDIFYDGAAPAHMLRAALYHDVAEHVFGDIPSPAKRLFNSSELRAKEDELMRSAGMFTILTDWERFVLKMCDLFDGLTYCTEERERGNGTLVSIWNTYHAYIKEKMLAELPLYEDELGYTTVTVAMGHASGLLWSRMELANAQR